METASEGFNPGMLMHFLPGLAIVASGWISKFYPRAVAILVFIATIALLFGIFSKGFTWGQIGTAVIIAIPLLTAGVCLYVPDNSDLKPADVS